MYFAIKPDNGGIPDIDNSAKVITTANSGLLRKRPLKALISSFSVECVLTHLNIENAIILEMLYTNV